MQTKGIYTPPETENTNTHLIFTNCEHAFIDIRCKIQTSCVWYHGGLRCAIALLSRQNKDVNFSSVLYFPR